MTEKWCDFWFCGAPICDWRIRIIGTGPPQPPVYVLIEVEEDGKVERYRVYYCRQPGESRVVREVTK